MSSTTELPETCGKCQRPVAQQWRHCSTCGADLGFPNVRACGSAIERQALNQNFENAKGAAKAAGLDYQFKDFVKTVAKKSSVVIAMPVRFARQFLSDESALYSNYEQLVESHARTPATRNDDRARGTVGRFMFGCYAEAIRYGALSLDGLGLSTYGDVHCKLRDNCVDARTSFLQENSFTYYEKHSVPLSADLPLGTRAVWENRGQLSGMALVKRLEKTDKSKDWASRLLSSDGVDRKNDVFIEAHVYGDLNRHAVEEVRFSRQKRSRSDENDLRILRDLLKEAGSPVEAGG